MAKERPTEDATYDRIQNENSTETTHLLASDQDSSFTTEER